MKKIPLKYSCSFWSSRPNEGVNFAVATTNFPTIFSAWWNMTKQLWRARRQLTSEKKEP